MSLPGNSIFNAETSKEKQVRVRIAKWGNSLAVRIPAGQAQDVGLAEDVEAELTVEHGRIIIAPLEPIPSCDLDALVEQITEANRHEEVETGAPVGPEFQ